MLVPKHLEGLKSLHFDVFGTVVDWRTSVIRELTAFGDRHGLSCDWIAFADAWRGLYQPAMAAVREGRRPFTILDQLHRESLLLLLEKEGISGLSESEIDDLTRAWHRLDPWPDVVAGLQRLKPRYVLATLSNGNVALMVAMARRAGLPWDVILGAEPARAYKPLPEAYLANLRALAHAPGEAVMVAAHNDDLDVARSLGMRTAFVLRAGEHGPDQTSDLAPTGAWDIVVEDFTALAEALGC
ncbi:MAG: haloacid dehalogenase type II [Rhizobiales bacterium]|nr:haloacid dehalogenase type II [Hyphomicrobiales bacterium]